MLLSSVCAPVICFVGTQLPVEELKAGEMICGRRKQCNGTVNPGYSIRRYQ